MVRCLRVVSRSSRAVSISARHAGPAEPVVNVHNLHYAYGRREVLHDVSLNAQRGVTALLGPNGAGKSTLLSILATLRKPASGNLSVAGWPLDKCDAVEHIHGALGYLPQHAQLPIMLRVQECLDYSAWVHGVAKRDVEAARTRVARLLEIDNLLDRRIGKLSGGQMQRVAIAATVIHQPAVLLLDEPTVGLDPEVRLELREALKKIGEHSCVLLSTHLIDDVQVLCDSVVIMSRGTTVFQGTPEELVNVAQRDARLPHLGSELETAYVAMIHSAQPPASRRG